MQTANERDERVMAILEEALQRPAPDRELFVRSQCVDDASLYREVMEELQSDERMGSFLREPFINFAAIPPPFHPGEVVAERFAIVREIGEGGMGIVYEAVDTKRQLQIAIKAAKPGFQRLLTPELQAALNVRHHNICVVNEIHTAQTEMGEIDFLTMELLEGQTLSAYISERGRLAEDEAMEIALQLCAAVGEAHRSGMLHRDLKTGNIFICEEEDGNRRVVVTDFGLASRISLVEAGLAGTPSYIAPELWAGQKASKESDIYALGVIFYSMLTGGMPYTSPEPPEEATPEAATKTVSVAQENYGAQPTLPLPPSSRVKHLAPRWDKVIMRCLALAPENRPHDVGEIERELRKKRIPKWPFAAAAAVLLIVAALVRFNPTVHDWVWPANVRIAVLPFQGPKELQPTISGALEDAAERIEALPSGRRTVAVIPPARAAHMHVETEQQARDLLHATHALKLSVHSEGLGIAGEASIVELGSQVPVRQIPVRYSAQDMGAISTALIGIVARNFHLRDHASSELSSAAMAAYQRGLYSLTQDTHGFDQAIALFQQAAQLDPSSALPPAGIARALVSKFWDTSQNVYLDAARDSARTALSRNPDSPTVLLAEGLIDEASSQYNKALEAYLRVRDLEPRNVDAWLRTAIVCQKLEEPNEALAAFRKAQELDPEYYRSYQLLGDFYYQRGEYAESAAQFRKMIALAPNNFDAYTSLASPLVELGDYEEAERVLQKSLSIRETASALNDLGAIRCRQGHYGEAVDLQKRALVYEPNNYNWLLNLGDNLRWARHSEEARPYYVKGRELAKNEMRITPQSARARAYFAYFSGRLGDSQRADEELAQAINLAPSDNEILYFALLINEMLGKRDAAVEIATRMTPSSRVRLKMHPDLAGFWQDPRFKN